MRICKHFLEEALRLPSKRAFNLLSYSPLATLSASPRRLRNSWLNPPLTKNLDPPVEETGKEEWIQEHMSHMKTRVVTLDEEQTS